MNETLGAVIKAARVEGMALTRRAFAERVGVTQEAVYAWDKGWRTPGGKLFVKLLRIVPPAFALRMLKAVGMRNPEDWALHLADEIVGSIPIGRLGFLINGADNDA